MGEGFAKEEVMSPDGSGGWTHEVVHAFPGAPEGANSY